MPQRIPPRAGVPPEYAGPDFLTSSLPPSCRPGHSIRPPTPVRRATVARHRGWRLSASILGLLAAVLFVAFLTWYLSGAVADAVIVGAFTALCAGLAAVMIGRPSGGG